MNEFAKRLREARKARSLTQEELAEKADISRVMVSRYENEMVVPTVEVLISLANALDVSIDYLLGHSVSTPTLPHTPPVSPLNDIHKNSFDKTDLPKSKAELRRFVLDILRECIPSNS